MHTYTLYLSSCLIVKNPIDSLLMRRLRNQHFCWRLGLNKDSKTLLWGHRRRCQCILLSSHRLGSRWIRLRGHWLRSRCIKLSFDWYGKEIWMHTISSRRIPSFGKSRCGSTLHRCRDRRSGRVDRSCCSRRCCSSSLWWHLNVARSCLAILSR